MTTLDDGILSNSTAWIAYYRDGEDVGVRGLFAKLTFSLAYSDDDARRDLKRKVVTLFCRCSTNAYRGLPPSSLPQPNLDSTAGQCGTTLDGHHWPQVCLRTVIEGPHGRDDG